MRSLFLVALGGVLIPSVFAADCDRACLKGVLDQYLNAVVQHNPSSVPLTPGYRQTENAAYFGTLEETSGNAAVVTLRLKVADRKVAEAEWYLARKGDPGIGVGAGAQVNWKPRHPARLSRISGRLLHRDARALGPNTYGASG